MSLDRTLFYSINGTIGRSAITDGIVSFFAVYLIFAVLAFFCFRMFRERKSGNFLFFCSALLGALVARFGIASGIRFFYHRLRPFEALHAPHLFTDPSFSFPSGHTIFLFALAAATYCFHKRLGLYIGIAGILVGVARVAAGVHYPSDIAGGVVLGVLTGVLVQVIFMRFIFPRVLRGNSR